MSKAKRLPVDKNDFDRIVLTDTLPVEVPIIFSNEGFYDWLRNHLRSQKDRRTAAEEGATELAGQIVRQPKDGPRITRPMKYRVSVDAARTRELALLHPSSQVAWARLYRDFGSLLIEACRPSPCSIRAPVRPARHVFVSNRLEDKNLNRLTKQDVDTIAEDEKVKHPGSYFAYRGFQRLHKFFDSDDFVALEKRYSAMWMLDVSNCFGSIYTHSVTWAVKSKSFVKSQVPQVRGSFSGKLDELMHRSNWNETHGILVGPETSRLFAEVIFQDVDVEILRRLKDPEMETFALRRYVDDYFVFAKDDTSAAEVATAIEEELWKYNLTLNHSKTRRYARPFITPRSAVVTKARAVCRELRDGLVGPAPRLNQQAGSDGPPGVPATEVPVAAASPTPPDAVGVGDPQSSPAQIGVAAPPGNDAPQRLVPHSLGALPELKLRRKKFDFLRNLKALCRELGSGYDLVALYVIATLDRMVVDLCRGDIEPAREQDYRELFLFILDLMFFFYSVQPSVAASLHLANASLLALRTLGQTLKDSANDVEQFVFEACWSFLESSRKAESHFDQGGAAIERLNIVSILSQLPNHVVPWDVLQGWVRKGPSRAGLSGSAGTEPVGLSVSAGIASAGLSDLGYFQLIVCMHYASMKRTDVSYAEALSELGRAAETKIERASKEEVAEEAGFTCLILDALSCPFLSIPARRSLLRKACASNDIPKPATNVEAENILAVFERRPWFVKWDEVELFSALERKRRTTVY